MQAMQQFLQQRFMQHLAKEISVFQKVSMQKWHQIMQATLDSVDLLLFCFSNSSSAPVSISQIKTYRCREKLLCMILWEFIEVRMAFPSFLQQLNHMQQSSFEQQEEGEEILEDDLAEYQQQLQQQICNEVMNFKGVVEDDAQQLQRSQSEEQGYVKKELTEAERQARDLKLKNARKYFEVVKLTYIKEVNAALKEAHFIERNHKEVVLRFLSQLSKELVQEYQRLKKLQPLSIKLEDVILFIKKGKDFISQQDTDNHESHENPAILFWSICESFKLACRKLFFFDLGSLVEETFYKLNYHHLEKVMKKEAKRAKQYQLMKIEIDLKKEEEQKKEGHDYLHFEDFQFNPNSFQKSRNSNKNRVSRVSETAELSQSQSQVQPQSNKFGLKARRENNFLRKRNYKWAYFHLFSSIQDKWKLINSEIHQFQEQSQFKSYLLSSKPIIGFYSFRILHFKQQFQPLSKLRLFQRLLHQDLTMYFFDSLKNISTRRKRVGVKYIMKDLLEKGSCNKHRFMLEHYDEYVMEKNDKIELQFQLNNFPKSKQELLNSQYFIIPSLMPQYSILDPKASPIDKEFNEEKVYLKRDLIPATSKMVWIDRGRRVKPDQVPVKKTENKSKNMSQLFLYEQTQPYHLNVDEQTGNFIPDDQYNSIYVPPDYHFDQRFSVVTKSIAGICNKHNFRYVRLVQGFTHSIGRILPNYIGFLVYKEDEHRIIELWQERQQMLMENKERNREKFLISLWNKLFTKIELSEWSHNFVASS